MEERSNDAKAVVNRRFAALNSHDPDRVRGVVHPQRDSRRQGMQAPARYIGRRYQSERDGLFPREREDPIKDFVDAYHGLLHAFPDMHIEVREQVADGDLVVSRITWTGTHMGEFAGLPATHRKVEFEEVLFWKVADGKVKESWAIAEELRLLGQLGVLPAS